MKEFPQGQKEKNRNKEIQEAVRFMRNRLQTLLSDKGEGIFTAQFLAGYFDIKVSEGLAEYLYQMADLEKLPDKRIKVTLRDRTK